MAVKILIVDDDPGVKNVLERYFEREGYDVSAADTGEEALQTIEVKKPDAVILDVNLPGLSGQDVCRRIRENPLYETIAVLVLTGSAAKGLPVACLDSGADDYIPKPVDFKELAARVRAVLRRPRTYADDDFVIQKGPVSIRRSAHLILINGRPLHLAPKEYELLSQLLLHSPRVIEKNTLAQKVWGVPLSNLHERTLDVHIRRIRQKLGVAAACLKTVQTIGFQWLPGDGQPSPQSSPSANRPFSR